MTKTKSEYYVRNSGKKDHLTILKIEQETFGGKSLSKNDLDDLFRSCYCLVVIFDNLTVGYLFYEKNRNTHSIAIQRLVVAEQYRGEGAATELLNKLHQNNLDDKIQIKVREQSTSFQLFLKHRGFLAVPIAYKKVRENNVMENKPCWIEQRGFENGDNALLMELTMTPENFSPGIKIELDA